MLVPPVLWLVWFVAQSLALYHLLGGAVPLRLLYWNRLGGRIARWLGAAVAFALARRGRMLIASVLGVGLHVAFGRRVARRSP